MKRLTDFELMTTDGGWDWGDFFKGFAFGASLGGAIVAGTPQALLAYGGGLASTIYDYWSDH